jgi:hypothetical protein
MLTGLLVWPDGRPAVGATVILWTLRDGRTRDSVFTTSDGEGRFSFPAYRGERYRVTAAFAPVPARATEWTARSSDFELTPESAHQMLTLAERRRPPR